MKGCLQGKLSFSFDKCDAGIMFNKLFQKEDRMPLHLSTIIHTNNKKKFLTTKNSTKVFWVAMLKELMKIS